MSLDAHLQVELGALSLDVELSAPAGSVLAILGPNGAGKTTILRTLAGLSPLAAGHVAVAGRRLDDPAAGLWVPPEGRGIGFVHQDLLLFPHLSLLDNVAFGPRSAGASRRASRELARPWLTRVGLADRDGDRPSTLSGGQAQRVALARALATEPDLLLLDEPLSALDVGSRAATRRDLHQFLQGFAGVTVVVTHDPLDARTLADEVIVLEDGAVTQAGPVAEVAADPRTPYAAELFGGGRPQGDDGSARSSSDG